MKQLILLLLSLSLFNCIQSPSEPTTTEYTTFLTLSELSNNTSWNLDKLNGHFTYNTIKNYHHMVTVLDTETGDISTYSTSKLSIGHCIALDGHTIQYNRMCLINDMMQGYQLIKITLHINYN